MNLKKMAEFIKELRNEKNMSQEDLADDLNIDRSVISRIESGERIPTTEHLVLLSKYFGVSTDEVLTGEKINKENKEIIENVNVTLYNDNINFRKKIKLLFILIFIMLFLCLGYYFFNFYNTVKIYTIGSESDDVKIPNGLFIKTKEKIYFKIDNIVSSKNIDLINIFYHIGEKTITLMKTTKLCNILIKDYYGYEEYFDFQNIEEIINNMFITITTKENEVFTVKLNFDKDYENDYFFVRKDKKITEKKQETIELEKSKINKKVLKLKEYILDKKVKIKYNKSEYEVYFIEDELKIVYQNDDIEYNLIYSDYIESEWLSKIELENFYGEQIYSYNISTDICNYGKCEMTKNDLNLISNIIDYILAKG